MVVRGTMRCDSERNNDVDNDERNRISTNQRDKSGGYDRGVDRGRVEAAALPAPSLCGLAQRSREMGIIRRDRQEFRPRGEGGDLSLRNRRRNNPHYG